MLHHYKHNYSHKVSVTLLLLFAVLAVYWQVSSHEFINFDDTIYLTENPDVRSGRTLKSIAWAWTTFHAGNWHPLTWMSHLLDVQLFGMNPGYHHLVNVFLHTANSIMLFFLLCRLTGAFWRCAMVAALFALHPLHVESVAWAAERKDVLSTLFWMLTLYLYARYTEQRNPVNYILALTAFTMGLMAKPMLVTLPVVLLLLDYWPLKRIGYEPEIIHSTRQSRYSLSYLLLEKVPFFILAVASCAVTIRAQQYAIRSFEVTSLSIRIANALVAYLTYLCKMMYPFNLAPFYPFDDTILFRHSLVAAFVFVVITFLAFRERQRQPYLIVGWLWYLCTLVPVIGIVQVGLQSMADRYTYIPLTGIFIMMVWGAYHVASRSEIRRRSLIVTACVILFTFVLVSWRQVSYWRNSGTLFLHAAEVTSGNYIAHYVLGREYVRTRQFDDARRHFDEAARIAPWYQAEKSRQVGINQEQERLDATIVEYREAAQKTPDSVSEHIKLGIVMAETKRFDKAIESFNRALVLNSQSFAGHYNLGVVFGRQGRQKEAIEHFSMALAIRPNDYDCHNSIGIALADLGRLDEAIEHFNAALRLEPGSAEAGKNREVVVNRKRMTVP